MGIIWALIVMGAPGSGKGTQAQRLSKALRLPHLSTGDMLRKAVEMGTALGDIAKQRMEAGDLVPDDVMCGIMNHRIAMVDCRRGFILDGFPRTMEQARCLDLLLQSKSQLQVAVFNIRVNEGLLVKRTLGRRVCSACGEIYNIYLKAPKKEGLCDKDGKKLLARLDDNETTCRERQRTYLKSCETLIEYYRSKNLLYDIEGEWEVGAVSAQIYTMLGKLRQELEATFESEYSQR